mgnify:CR=1 FL=1
MSEPENLITITEALRQPLLRDFFGFEMIEYDTGSATVAVDRRDELGHMHGWFQGAVISGIAEFAGAFAAILSLPLGRVTTTVDQTIKFMGPARGDRLVARGRIIKPSKTLIPCAIDVFVVRDGAEHLCATMLQSNMVAPPAG